MMEGRKGRGLATDQVRGREDGEGETARLQASRARSTWRTGAVASEAAGEVSGPAPPAAVHRLSAWGSRRPPASLPTLLLGGLPALVRTCLHVFINPES